MNGNLRYAVVSTAISDDVRQVAALTRRAGFHGVQFDAYGSVNLTELSASGRREFRHMVTAQDQEIAGLRVDIGNRGFSRGADVDKTLDRIEKAVEAAAGLMAGAAPLVCIDVGPMPTPAKPKGIKPKARGDEAGLILLPTPDLLPAELRLEEEQEPGDFDSAAAAQIDAAMSELGHRADRYNVTVAFRSALASLGALERTLASANCPRFGADLDPVSMLRDGWSVDQTFSRLGASIRHVRGRDAVGGAEGRTKPATVGEGSTQWEALLAALDDSAYSLWITIDPNELPNRAASALAGLKHLTSRH